MPLLLRAASVGSLDNNNVHVINCSLEGESELI